MTKKILFTVLTLSSVIFFSCKKDNTDTTTKYDSDKKTESKSTVQNENRISNGPFAVKNISEITGNKNAVEFSWLENDKEVKLSDYKGKVILINFWATWCPPCRHELPALNQISQELTGKDFKMIGVSVDELRPDLNKFLASNNLSYTIIHEPMRLTEKYMQAGGVSDNVIPQTYIINKDGKIVESIIGSKTKPEFMKLINKYL